MSITTKKNVKRFDDDVTRDGGYEYTGHRMSSRLANGRITDAFRELYSVEGRSFLDIGCGDGTYSLELAKDGASFVLGIDPSQNAIKIAQKKALELEANIEFRHGNIYDLAIDSHFDCIILRGVLHHLPNPEKAISCLASYAPRILIMEPNGYNPILKIIEKTSSYHIKHEEQSFPLYKINQWLKSSGYDDISVSYVNLVPMFCPDMMAIICKKIEPYIEKVPGLRTIACGQFIILAQKVNVDG